MCQVHPVLVKRVQCTVRSFLFKFLGSMARLVHLWTDQRIPGPVSCRCPEPGWFVGNPTPLARDNILD